MLKVRVTYSHLRGNSQRFGFFALIKLLERFGTDKIESEDKIN